MNISIIAASHRKNSQSLRVANIISQRLKVISKMLNNDLFDLAELNLPFWSDVKEKGTDNNSKKWSLISERLCQSLGFVLVVPEYGGMASPFSKNLFLLTDKGEFFHKPGLIVSISSGVGGAYPISELRSSSYKNTHIMWIPENIIIRNVNHYNPGAHGRLIPEWMDKRVDYCLKLLILYSSSMKNIQGEINKKDFGNGM
jgi:NAD(P)H-dependent FMN reductase